MMTDTAGSLKDLQELDLILEEVQVRIAGFDPLLAEVEEPALALEKEITTAQARLTEMKTEERHLENAADDRRARTKLLQERLKAVRNLREEAAGKAEMDLLQQNLETAEREALSLLDQIRKLEDRLEELTAAQAASRAEVEPRRKELIEAQKLALDEFTRLKLKRDHFAKQIP